MSAMYTVKTRGVGLPDYAQAKPVGSMAVGPVYTSADVAELAARLGSIDTFDRRGNVIWMDNFDGGIEKWGYFTNFPRPKWLHIGHTGDGFCMEVSRDAGVGNMQEVDHTLPYPVLSKIGLEVSCNFIWGIWTVELFIDCYTGTKWYGGRVRYDFISKILSIAVDPWDARQELPSLGELIALGGISIFHNIKLVCDFATGKYERLVIDGVKYDLTSYYLWEEDSDVVPHLAVEYYIDNASAIGQCQSYLDSVIVTQNEPANPIA